MHNVNQSLLLEEPALKVIEDPFQRFYTYRAGAEFTDRDRSHTAQNVYRQLRWYDDTDKLEPDTFFASSHHLIRELLNKYDKPFYVNDFKKFCVAREIAYDTLSASKGSYYRYLWMIESNVISHYNFIVHNPSVLDYIVTTHEIGNFMIIPKGFGWDPKCKSFHESPFKSLHELEHNWDKYSCNYGIVSFLKFKEFFMIEDFYMQGKLKTALDIDFQNNSFPEIFKKIEMLSKLIRIRTQKINLLLGKIA